ITVGALFFTPLAPPLRCLTPHGPLLCIRLMFDLRAARGRSTVLFALSGSGIMIGGWIELCQFCHVGYESDCDLSSEKILIKRGTVMNAHRKEVAEVYIEVGIVVSVRPNIKVSWSLSSAVYNLVAPLVRDGPNLAARDLCRGLLFLARTR
ncbi:hypothetical protein GW17_00027176, partial [Ensete ventricosum]